MTRNGSRQGPTPAKQQEQAQMVCFHVKYDHTILCGRAGPVEVHLSSATARNVTKTTRVQRMVLAQIAACMRKPHLNVCHQSIYSIPEHATVCTLIWHRGHAQLARMHT